MLGETSLIITFSDPLCFVVIVGLNLARRRIEEEGVDDLRSCRTGSSNAISTFRKTE